MMKRFAFLGLAMAYAMLTNPTTGVGEIVPSGYRREARHFGERNQRQRRKKERQVPQRRK